MTRRVRRSDGRWMHASACLLLLIAAGCGRKGGTTGAAGASGTGGAAGTTGAAGASGTGGAAGAGGVGGAAGTTGQGGVSGQGGGTSCGSVERPSSNLTPGTCTFSVPPPPTNDGTTTRANISVHATNIAAGAVAIVPNDATNGWTYADASMTSIVLHGVACDLWTEGTYSDITIVFHCLF